MIINKKTGKLINGVQPYNYDRLMCMANINSLFNIGNGEIIAKDNCKYEIKEEVILVGVTHESFLLELYNLLVSDESFEFIEKFPPEMKARKCFVALFLIAEWNKHNNVKSNLEFSCSQRLFSIIRDEIDVHVDILYNRYSIPGINFEDLDLYDETLHDVYKEFCQCYNYLVPKFVTPPNSYYATDLKVNRIHPEAVLPKRARHSDAGIDITLISLIRIDEFGTEWYHTGIRLQPDSGYYTELIGRSSLIKRGRQLANCVGIIDGSYRNNLLVCLTKLHPSAPPLELPLRACQLILRKSEKCNVVEVLTLTPTQRGMGGFGSTGH